MAGCARGERGGEAASRDDERWGGGEEEDEAVAGWTGARRLAWVVVAMLDDARARAELCGRAETSESFAAPTSATLDTPRQKACRGAGRLQVRVGYILVERLALASQAQRGERRPSPRTGGRGGCCSLAPSSPRSLLRRALLPWLPRPRPSPPSSSPQQVRPFLPSPTSPARAEPHSACRILTLAPPCPRKQRVRLLPSSPSTPHS